MADNRVLVIKPDYDSWPLGLAYVLSCLKRCGMDIDFVDTSRTSHWKRDVVSLLEENEYLFVCSGGLIGFYSFFSEIGELVRKHAPGVPFVLGGNITKDGKDELLFSVIGIDYGILGEAETAMPAFMQGLSEGVTDFSGYDGVIFRNAEGQVVRNKYKRLDLKDYNVLPAWEFFDCEYYLSRAGFPYLGDGLRFMPTLSGRGCVGKCTFCSPSVGGFRKRPIPEVIEEIKYLIKNYDFDKLQFLNEMFYPTAREVREFCHAYMELEERKPWFVQIRVDSNLDTETLKLMKDAGCIAVSVGIESGSADILDIMNKKIKPEQIRAFFRAAREVGMPACGTFIVGYDGEAEEDIKQTIDLVIEEEISTTDSLLFLYQGTPVYEKALDLGVIQDEVEHLKRDVSNVFAPDVKDHFCNLTRIPDEDFFHVVGRQVRRYHSFLFDRFKVRNLKMGFLAGKVWTHFKMSGNCAECGNPVEYTYHSVGDVYSGFLGEGVYMNMICQKCYKPLAYDIYKAEGMEPMAAHLEQVRQILPQRRKVVVCGVNANLKFFMRIDLTGMDYSKICGIYSYDPSYRVEVRDTYIDYPVFDEDMVVDAEPDCLLCLDELQDNSRLVKAFQKRGRPVPEMLYLSDPGFRERLKQAVPLAYRVNRVFMAVTGKPVRSVLSLDFLRRARDLVAKFN